MTSNIGSQYLIEGIQDGKIPADVLQRVENDLRQSFRPEFLNRVDDTIIFKPLTKNEIKQIVMLLIEELRKRMEERGLGLELTDTACDFIADTAYDPVYGARPLKRYIQRQLETKVARTLIGGDIEEGTRIVVDASGGELVVKVEEG
jgi:ATP-dependent Clp protease ATP-binding subunit ClpB